MVKRSCCKRDYAAMKVFTDGENLFVASGRRQARELYVAAFGGDTPSCRLRVLPPMKLVAMYADDEETEIRMRAYTVARCYPDAALLAR